MARFPFRIPIAGIIAGGLLGAAAMGFAVLRQPQAPIPAAAPPVDTGIVAVPSDDPRIPPSFWLTPSPSPSPTPSKSPSPSASPSPSPRRSPSPPPGADLAAFRGLSTWFDVYDYGSAEPFEAARTMRARGVRTLLIQTGRYTLPDDFKDADELATWVQAAHAAGMRIVGWYLPGYGDLDRDVRRTVAIATFRTPDGQRFDGIGVDIEDKCEIKGSTCKSAPASPTLTEAGWNSGIVTHMNRVRSAVGKRYPMAGIIPPPLGMDIRPAHWTNFPWHDLPRGFDVIVPMSYWSYRTDCSTNPSHCADGYTSGNVREVRERTGVPTIPVHIAGGVADSVTAAEVADFVRAARSVGVIGGSLYDYRTTERSYWPLLAKLNG